jgi:hypothetical protein
LVEEGREYAAILGWKEAVFIVADCVGERVRGVGARKSRPMLLMVRGNLQLRSALIRAAMKRPDASQF